MISIDQYFGNFEHTDEHKKNALELLDCVGRLLDAAKKNGIILRINPATDSYISGTQYGGFRPQDCPIGAPKSSHKLAMAVDIYDPYNELDNWINDPLLIANRLYREHPSATIKWCHLTTKAPKSRKRTFFT